MCRKTALFGTYSALAPKPYRQERSFWKIRIRRAVLQHELLNFLATISCLHLVPTWGYVFEEKSPNPRESFRKSESEIQVRNPRSKVREHTQFSVLSDLNRIHNYLTGSDEIFGSSQLILDPVEVVQRTECSRQGPAVPRNRQHPWDPNGTHGFGKILGSVTVLNPTPSWTDPLKQIFSGIYTSVLQTTSTGSRKIDWIRWKQIFKLSSFKTGS